jgi:octaprenyl-diphosphate synthase
MACEVALRELIVSDVAEVPSVAGYLLDAGGKRLRPALTALGARAAGLTGSIARLMCVGELIHLGSLLHDDVVDDAEVRRGLIAAHRLHGPATTVLTGDFCLARAVLLAAEEGGFSAVTGLSRAVTEMAEGEVLQLRNAGNLDCTRDDYLDVIDRKSAALIAWCASAGALAQDNSGAAEALSTFGRAVGRAFQVTDDVLDYSEGTGKKPGADLRECKLTLPLLYAIEVDMGLKAEVEKGLRDQAQLEDWMHRVRDSGGLTRALDDAHRWVDGGVESLDALPHSIHRDALAVLGRYLVERTG